MLTNKYLNVVKMVIFLKLGYRDSIIIAETLVKVFGNHKYQKG